MKYAKYAEYVELAKYAEYAEFTKYAEFAKYGKHAEYAKFAENAEYTKYAEFAKYAKHAEYAKFAENAEYGEYAKYANNENMQNMQNISKYADWLKQSTPRFVVPLAMFVHLDTGPILNINEQEPNIVFQVEGEALLIQWWGRQVGSLCPSCLAQVRLFITVR